MDVDLVKIGFVMGLLDTAANVMIGALDALERIDMMHVAEQLHPICDQLVGVSKKLRAEYDAVRVLYEMDKEVTKQ